VRMPGRQRVGRSISATPRLLTLTAVGRSFLVPWIAHRFFRVNFQIKKLMPISLARVLKVMRKCGPHPGCGPHILPFRSNINSDQVQPQNFLCPSQPPLDRTSNYYKQSQLKQATQHQQQGQTCSLLGMPTWERYVRASAAFCKYVVHKRMHISYYNYSLITSPISPQC
jgi:hypothetical protein